MVITTADVVPGQAVQILGLAYGSAANTKDGWRQLNANVRNGFFGGEISQYTKTLDEACMRARDRMIQQADALGADAIVSMRFSTSTIDEGTLAVIAYGTAVKFVESHDYDTDYWD